MSTGSLALSIKYCTWPPVCGVGEGWAILDSSASEFRRQRRPGDMRRRVISDRLKLFSKGREPVLQSGFPTMNWSGTVLPSTSLLMETWGPTVQISPSGCSDGEPSGTFQHDQGMTVLRLSPPCLASASSVRGCTTENPWSFKRFSRELPAGTHSGTGARLAETLLACSRGVADHGCLNPFLRPKCALPSSEAVTICWLSRPNSAELTAAVWRSGVPGPVCIWVGRGTERHHDHLSIRLNGL